MKTGRKWSGFVCSYLVVSMLPFYGFAATKNTYNINSLVNIFIYGVLLLMIVLFFILIKGVTNLNKSTHQNEKERAAWINHKLYDFNKDELEILIKEIKRLENENQIKPLEN